MSESNPTMVITVDYPEGCRGKIIKHSRRTRYYPRGLNLAEVLIVEGDDGRPYYDVFRVTGDPVWRWVQ